MKIKSFIYLFFLSLSSYANIYNCETTEEIIKALKNVKSGDKIIIAPGTYTSNKLTKGAYFFSNSDGTILKPITIKSYSKTAKVFLKGKDIGKGAILKITGNNWIINGLDLTNGLKGLLLDNSNNSSVINCNIYKIGNEAIHIRDGSSNTIINNCKIYNTGNINPGFGEGIYIGSDKKVWSKYNHKCNNTLIENSEIGPNVKAESIDIKEGTQTTIIKKNKFIGLGISGENSAKSFISIKGIKNKVFSNFFDATGESNILSGISNINRNTELSGYDNFIYKNTFHIENKNNYVVRANKGTSNIYAINNKRIPEGKMYNSKIIKSYPKETNQFEEVYVNNFNNSRYKFYGTAIENIDQSIKDGILKLEMKPNNTLSKYSPILFRFPSSINFTAKTKIIIRVKSEHEFKIRLDIHDGTNATNGKNGRVSAMIPSGNVWKELEFNYSDLAFTEKGVNRKSIKRINFQLNPGKENFPSPLYVDYIKVVSEVNTEEKNPITPKIKTKIDDTKKHVILKLDDFRANTKKSYNKNWQKLINTIRQEKIKAAIGIVAVDLINANQTFKDSLSYLHKTPSFEVWHHGWDHKRNNYGVNQNNKGEFSGTPYEFQKEHFEKSMLFANSQLGIVMKTFGAPFNQTDQVFSQVIRENKYIKVWLYPNDKLPYNGIKLLRGRNNLLESKTGIVSYKSFLTAYKNNTTNYLVLQGHPGKWDSNSFNEFNKVIKFLKKEGVVFTLPYDYYLMQKNN